MPQVKHYTAKREMRLDCGHTVQSGDAYQVVSAFACEADGHWPLSILMACFAVMTRKRSPQPSAPETKAGPEEKAQAPEPTAS